MQPSNVHLPSIYIYQGGQDSTRLITLTALPVVSYWYINIHTSKEKKKQTGHFSPEPNSLSRYYALYKNSTEQSPSTTISTTLGLVIATDLITDLIIVQTSFSPLRPFTDK